MGLHAIDEAKRCLNCKKPKCREGCPINTPIPEMIQMFLGGQMTEAAEMVLRGVLGFRDDYLEHIHNKRCLFNIYQPVPCVVTCPAHVDVPGYVALIREGRYQDAVRLMKQRYGIDMEQSQYSKTIDKIPMTDIAISMGCDVGCPYIGRAFDDDWGLADPTGKSDEHFIQFIEEIARKIRCLDEANI